MVRRNRIIVLIFFFCLLGCKQEKNEIVETKRTNNILKEEEMSNNMDEYEEILNRNGFKYPSEEIFNSKIKQFFGLNLKENKDNEVNIIPKNSILDETVFYPKAIVKKKYIYWMQDDEGSWDDLAFVNLNKYIFYNDKAAFTYLKIKDSNGYLSSLVYCFGYDKDEDLLKYMFYNSKGSLSDYSTVFFGRNGVNGLFELRKELFNKYLEYNPNADISVTSFIPCLIDKTNENYITNFEGNRESDAAFILEKILYQMEQKGETLISGSVDYILSHYPNYLENLKKNKSYN